MSTKEERCWAGSEASYETAMEAEIKIAAGGKVLELDANCTGTVTGVYQDVTTVAGQTYQLTLDVAQRAGYAAATNSVEVFWEGSKIATIDPASTTLTKYVFTVTANDASSRLEFREQSGDDDSIGGIIDNVCLVTVNAGGAVGNTIQTTLESGENDLTWDAGLTVEKVTATFDFSGNTATDGTDGNVRCYTNNGISVNACAWSRDKSSGAWSSALRQARPPLVPGQPPASAAGAVARFQRAEPAAFRDGRDVLRRLAAVAAVPDRHRGRRMAPNPAEAGVFLWRELDSGVAGIVRQVEMTTVLLVTLTMLFLSKLLVLLLLLKDGRSRRAYGGMVGATLSVVLETVFSVLTAPVLMLFQTKFVLAILMRRAVGWPLQQRSDHMTSFREAALTHGVHTLIGLAAGALSYWYVPAFFWWFTPVLAGLVLSMPVSMLSSSMALGGEMGHAPEGFLKNFEKNFEGPNAPNPQWVADAVLNLIKAPRGSRPFRTTVDRLGMGAAVEPYNKAADDMQKGMYAAFGMADVLQLKM